MATTGTEKITNRIIQEASQQANEIKQQAQRSADQTYRQATEQAEKNASVIIEQAKSSMPEREKRVLSVAELELRKMDLAMKRRALDETFRQAQEAFCALSDEAYQKAYAAIVLPAVSKGTERVDIAKADEARLGQAFIDGLNAARREAGQIGALALGRVREDIAHGCIVCDGGMEINLSAQAVMRDVREQAEAEIAAMLFPEEG